MLVTLARAASGLATKRHRLGPAGGVITEGYPAGESRWALYRRDVPNLSALSDLLREIGRDTCLLRGEQAPFVPPGSLVRRRLGETVLDRPTELVVCDIDDLPIPAAIDPITDPLDAALYAAGRLPDEYHEVSFAYAHSASAGFSPDRLKVKLFYQATAPVDGETARAYQKGVNEAAGFRLLDPSVTGAAQLIYVAAPVCEPPLRDPLGGSRYGFWPGLENKVAVDLGRCVTSPASSGGPLGTGWRRHLCAIGGPEGFREPIVRAICAAVAEAGGLPENPELLADEIAAAVLAADPGGRDRRTIERYASAAHTREIASWAARQQAHRTTQVERLRTAIFRTEA